MALEGLDGITIPCLWIRLENRASKFPLKLDPLTKQLLWTSLVHNTDISFHRLPQEREDIVLFDRFKDIDPDTGIQLLKDDNASKDIYPVHMIVENKDGIQGSCATFKQRKDITEQVRSDTLTPLMDLQEALERYGRTLVVVASQKLRFRTLIGSESDPDLKLSDESYCLLERVGRARWQGELQRDLHVCAFKVDARKLHYMRKSLVKHGLISMQSHCARTKMGQQQHSILLQLKRFSSNRRSKYDILMEYVSNILQQAPGQVATLVSLRDLLNVDDNTFKRAFQCMRSAKLVDICQYPLEDVDPSGGPCTTARGNKISVRCARLLKPYTKKGVPDDDDDEDDEDQDVSEARRRAPPPEGRILELDVLSQAYEMVLSCGTKGIAQTAIGSQMNVGKLEARMICRRLERDGVITGFMVDEGRQRTTKFISHKCVGVSNQLQLFAKEQERNKLLYSSAPQSSDSEPAAPETPAAKKIQNGSVPGNDKAGDREGDAADESLNGKGGKGRGKSKAKQGGVKAEEAKPETPVAEIASVECETQTCSKPTAPKVEFRPGPEQAPIEEETDLSPPSASSAPQAEELTAANETPSNNVVVVKDVVLSKRSLERSHETYRLLRRKNLIIEAVRNSKIIEGLFPLQKMISDEEKEAGLTSKCCKKSILRLVQGLSREGLLKIYKTTIIQDGITKNVLMVVHPSIQPNDDAVTRLIEQIRFKISSSYTAVRLHQAEEKAKEGRLLEEMGSGIPKDQKDRKKRRDHDAEFKPTTVRGLGKSFGFQPKMHRLRAVHNFIWYLIHGHPCGQNSGSSDLDSDIYEKQDLKSIQNSTGANGQTQPSESAAASSADPQTAESSLSNLDVTTLSNDEGEPKDQSEQSCSESDLKVYVDEESWKRFLPPVRINKDYPSGWAMVGHLLLCIPLSIFIQIIQINYKVDGLEEYLSDPIKQHYLVRALPARMRRQLLYKRRYIFCFHENLQRLVCMGLVQFRPIEKFKEKDQVYLYVMRNATIVDTTSAEPHYWLATESPDKPFERRHYVFNTAEDVENYWFDLMCVCLNTPLGVIRAKRNTTEEDAPPSFVHERSVLAGMAHLLKGSLDVCDDGSIPGDGKGAGGLDSEFFAHLKRNWLWTNHLLSDKKAPAVLETQDKRTRLKSLLSKNILRIALKAGGSTMPRYLTTKNKRPRITENVEVDVEPATRNQQVVGGKRQKRKRRKKEVVKAPRKKRKEPKKRTPAHDEKDRKALKMMTRQRVYWSVQEDSLVMLCSVASHVLNSMLKRPFIPYCVVRDLLHDEFEISADKTSVAVGRRKHYILRNPQTLLNYRICLAEVYQDKALMKELEEKKPADPDNPEDCAQVYSEFVRLLRQKFSSFQPTQEIDMPDTKRQLFSRFNVSAIDSRKQMPHTDEINFTDDIHSIVLHNLIQSTLAMTNIQMKSSRSFQTFHIYSQYDQELLCQVFIQCRKRGLVNRRRVGQPFGPKKNRALPILPMSYQLSQSYYRCFSWRFPHLLCTDAFQLLKSLKNNPRDDRPMITFYHETESRTENREEVTETKPGCEKRAAQNRGKEAGSSEPDAQPERAKDGESDQRKEGGEHGAATERREAAKDPPDVAGMQWFPLDSPGGACMASLSLMSLGLLNVHLSIPKQMVLVDSNLVENDVVKSMAVLDEEDDDEEDGDECEGKKKLEVKAHQASHTNYLMMRGYCSPGIINVRNLNTNDNVVMESCLMRLQRRTTPAHNVFGIENLPSLDLSQCGPFLLPPLLSFSTRSSCSPQASVEEGVRGLIEERGYTPQDAEACAQLMRSLDAAGEKGLDVHDFCQAHADLEEPESGRTLSLQQYMKDLQEEDQVLQVGGVGPRWVLMKHAKPWLLTVKSKPWTQSQMTSDRLRSLKKERTIPFLRKRRRREVPRETECLPEKKAAVSKHDSAVDVEGVSCDATAETLTEEEQLRTRKESTGEGSGDKLLEEEVEEQRDEEDCIDAEKDEDASPPTTGPAAGDDENMSFISRPWRMVDGTLNRPVCKGMLEALLYHIMSQPGLTQQSLVTHYRNVLQPMVLLDLVQALIEMGCVTKKTLIKSPRPSLFGRSVQPTESASRAKPEEPDCVFYEPTISCCLRLCQVLPNERHWNNTLP